MAITWRGAGRLVRGRRRTTIVPSCAPWDRGRKTVRQDGARAGSWRHPASGDVPGCGPHTFHGGLRTMPALPDRPGTRGLPGWASAATLMRIRAQRSGCRGPRFGRAKVGFAQRYAQPAVRLVGAAAPPQAPAPMAIAARLPAAMRAHRAA